MSWGTRQTASVCSGKCPWEGRRWTGVMMPCVFLCACRRMDVCGNIARSRRVKVQHLTCVYRLKCIHRSVRAITTSQIPERFHHPPRKPSPVSSYCPLSSPPGLQALIYFCLWICSFCAFPINRLVQYVTSCVWLLSLSTVFPRLIHVVAYVGIWFLSTAQ